MFAGLKKIPQRIIVRYGNRLHPQAPSSSHSSWLPPSLFVCLYPKHPRGVCMLKNSSRSKKLLATNSSHSGSAAALTSHILGSSSRQQSSSQSTASSSGNSIQLRNLDSPPPHTTNPHKYKRSSRFTSESIFDIFIDTLNVQEKSPGYY